MSKWIKVGGVKVRKEDSKKSGGSWLSNKQGTLTNKLVKSSS